MEMLNIQPAQPQTKPTTATKDKTDKGENASFLKVLGQANQNAQNDQQKGSVNSAVDEEVAERSQSISATAGEESSKELDAEDTAGAELALIAPPGLPLEPVPAHGAEPALMVNKGQRSAEDFKSADMSPLLSEANGPNAKPEGTQEASASNARPGAASQNVATQNASTDLANRSVFGENIRPDATGTTTAMDSITPEATVTQATTVGIATETLPSAEKNLADRALAAELTQRTAFAGSRQKISTPANAEALSGKAPEQPGMVSDETSKQTGLMESNLGNFLQETRPLREQSRGRQATDLNRSETASLAIQGDKSAQVIAGTQNEDSLPSFASKQENGFSAVQADAATNGTNTAINATPFEAILEGGMNGSPAVQQATQPLQATSVEAGSIRLASGEFLSDDQIVNQVLDGISVRRAGNQSRIVIRMNPEELGEVKLALTLEKDQLRAQLLTQNNQVQEILEKHLPKLHEALSQQGVKLEDIQVGVDSNRHNGQEAFADHRQPESFRRHFNASAGTINNDLVHSATASTGSVTTEGLSLRI